MPVYILWVPFTVGTKALPLKFPSETVVGVVVQETTLMGIYFSYEWRSQPTSKQLMQVSRLGLWDGEHYAIFMNMLLFGQLQSLKDKSTWNKSNISMKYSIHNTLLGQLSNIYQRLEWVVILAYKN
jgi:hypothetical protein